MLIVNQEQHGIDPGDCAFGEGQWTTINVATVIRRFRRLSIIIMGGGVNNGGGTRKDRTDELLAGAMGDLMR